MPNQKWEVYKNHETGILFDLTDADAQGKLTAILDGTNIDSFADVESALAGKEDTLTFDNAPTDGSDNPVKSDGVYDALQEKVSWDEQAVLGAKNVLENTAVSGTQNDVVYVVNDDKSVTLESGTASSTVFIRIGQIQDKGSLILNGTTGGSFEKYGLTVRTADLQSPSFGAVDNYNGDTAFTIPSDYSNPLYVYVRVPTGSTVSNVVIKPMVSLSGGEYAPYAMTNKQLTEAVEPIPFFDMSKTVYSSGTYKDLNDVMTSGIYAVFFSALNKPSDITGSLNNATLIVTANPANNAVTQTLIDGDHKAIYIRFGVGGDWSGSWSKFTGTPVS